MNYGNIKSYDIADGTGVRVSLFVSGCRHHCKGCFNGETWDFNSGKEFKKENLDYILENINKNSVQRDLSILGGEPLCPENVDGVIEVCKRFKEERGVEMKTIKITADNKISIVDVDFSNNRAIMDAMGGPVEVVTTNELYDFFKCPVLMMLDKNGYKPKDVNGFCPSANAVASFLYGYVKTGIPILGDVILAQPAGGRIENLEGVGELEEKMQMLMQRFSFLETT